MTAPAPTVVPLFAALADDTRWSILVRLGEGPASASRLARELPISRQAITQHLRVLGDVGLVSSERRGREVLHVAHGSRLSEVARHLERVGARWEARLARIKALAEHEESGRAP